jgi:hypothetical protein
MPSPETPVQPADAETARHRAADGYDAVADDLEAAAAHLRHTARHYRNGDVPRACAHVVAAQGHLSVVDRELRSWAEFHATRASR